MMKKNLVMRPILGTLKGFTKNWNPFNREVFARVQLDEEAVIDIPIDYRQQKFVMMEHPVDSPVAIIFAEGRWQITSETIMEKIFPESNTVYN